MDKGVIELEAKASKLRHAGYWQKAREVYQELLEQNLTPLDRIKTLANVMQMYEMEDEKENAIKVANEALKLYDVYPLPKTGISVFLHGFLVGSIKRLGQKSFWFWTPPFGGALPLEMNLSLFDQLRTRLATAAFGAAFGSTIGSQIPSPSLVITWSNGQISVLTVIGSVFAFFATNKLLEQATQSVLVLSRGTIPNALRTAVNITSLVGFGYCLLFPSIVTDPYNWWSVIIIPCILGVFYYWFFIIKHVRVYNSTERK